MKAITLAQKGSLDNIEISEQPIPRIADNQVLIKVKTCGVNPVDWKGVINGIFAMPYTIGSDIAGVVEGVSASVHDFKVGDEVIGSLPWATQGAFAEYVTTEPQYLTHKPRNLLFEQAAAVPLAALTAWQGLFDHLKLQQGGKIVVQAAAGGVGMFAVQLAKWKGARVVAVASQKNESFVRSLGADEVVDYKQGFDGLQKDFDCVFDSMASSAQTIPLLKKGGRYVSITAKPSPDLAAEYSVMASNFLFHSDQQQLREIVGLIEAGVLSVHLDKVFPLTEAKQALAYQQEGRSRGKNVLVVE